MDPFTHQVAVEVTDSNLLFGSAIIQNGNLSPKGNATRAEVATMIMRLSQKLKMN